MKVLSSLLHVLSTIIVVATTTAINVGDEIPSGLELDFGFPPIKVALDHQRIKGRKVLLVGLPGAFTPT